MKRAPGMTPAPKREPLPPFQPKVRVCLWCDVQLKHDERACKEREMHACPNRQDA